MNNNDLVDIVYSEAIGEYVLIIKRFPNIPVILKKYKFTTIYKLCHYKDKDDDIYYSTIFSDEYATNDYYNTFNKLTLSSDNNYISYLKIVSGLNGHVINEIEITNLEKFEIINKILELREILIERGEIYEED